eukprot:11334954-Alexandrium_andersonii.AAC.1
MGELGLNASLGVFVPKGDSELMEGRVARKAEDTRPLNLKNTDNKAIAAVANRIVSVKLPGWARVAQRGFVPGRQGLDSV